MTTDVEASEYASTLATLAKLRRTQEIGKYAEARVTPPQHGRDTDHEQWWEGYSFAMLVMAKYCLSMMPGGKWFPEGG